MYNPPATSENYTEINGEQVIWYDEVYETKLIINSVKWIALVFSLSYTLWLLDIYRYAFEVFKAMLISERSSDEKAIFIFCLFFLSLKEKQIGVKTINLML